MEISLSLFIHERAHTHTFRFELFWEASTKQHAFSSAKFLKHSTPPPTPPESHPRKLSFSHESIVEIRDIAFQKRKPAQNLYFFPPRKEDRDVCLLKLWTKSVSIAFKPAGYLSLPDLLWTWNPKAWKLCWNTVKQITRNAAGMAWLLTLLFSSTQTVT